MVETPDFEAIGRVLAVEAGYSGDRVADRVAASITQQLRLVWNARGAADVAAVHDRLSTLVGWVTSEPYRNQLAEAITALNREDTT